MGESGDLEEFKAMTKMSANSAKARFGELLDIARREPVIIEKHGRPVAVVLSTEDYNELENLKLARLRDEVDAGLHALDEGDYVEVDAAGLKNLATEIKTTGRNTASE